MRVGPIGSYPVSPWNRSLVNRNQRLKSIKAPEFKYGSEIVDYQEVQEIRRCENGKWIKVSSHSKRKKTKKLDKEQWLKSLYTEKASYGQFVASLQMMGHSPIDAKTILDESIHQSERATDWAISNEHYGSIAANSALVSLVLSIANTIVNNTSENNSSLSFISSISPTIKQTLSTVEMGAAALRGYIQYENIYGGRMDDDRAKNKYEAEVHGNKIAGIFSDLAYIFETNINPVALIALNFTSDKTNESIRPLLSLCNSLWWRVRMLGEIDQKFGTDLFTYLINKPLALVNIKSGVDKVKEIKDSGYFTYEYIQERLIELIGLDPNEHKLSNVFPEVGRLLKSLFSEDKDLAKKSSENLGKFLAPIFGFYGFAAYGVGVPVKSILHLFEKESKWVNLLSKSGVASQQLLYLFRIFLPEQFENISDDTANLNNEEKLTLQKERTRLFHKGLTVCTSNILATLLQLIDTEESSAAVKIGKKVVEEVADKGINYFFSARRKLLGKKHRLDNPELYNIDGTAKIILDKVRIEDEKELAVKAA